MQLEQSFEYIFENDVSPILSKHVKIKLGRE